MCLTLPEVLITVMGIEKLVPTWRDLEVFLQLLPRSSTAERMNPYTSIWTGVTPGDGPQAFHLILLDNGRTDVLSDTTGRQALRCIRCSACLNVCPGLRADRRAGLRLGLPGTDRGDPDAAAARHREAPGRQADGVAAVRLVAVRRLLRCLSRPDRHPRGPRPPARPGRPPVRGDPPRCRRPRPSAMGAAAWTLRTPRRLGLAERAAGLAGRVVRAARSARRLRGPGPVGAWFRARDLKAPGARIVPGLVAPHRRRTGRARADGDSTPRRPRDAVLGRIRAALADDRRRRRVPRDYERRSRRRRTSHELFVERVGDYRATVHRTTRGEPARRRRRGAGRARRDAPRRARRASRTRGSPRADVERVGDDPPLTLRRARSARRGHHRLRRGDRRDRHDRARRAGRTRAAGRSACCPTSTSASSWRARSSAPCRRRWHASTRPGRRRGSAARRRPATSSCSGSRASTARARLDVVFVEG